MNLIIGDWGLGITSKVETEEPNTSKVESEKANTSKVKTEEPNTSKVESEEPKLETKKLLLLKLKQMNLN